MIPFSIDSHLDVPWVMHKWGRFDLSKGSSESQFSLPKAHEGGLQSAFFALYLHENAIDTLGERGAKDAIRNQVLRISDQTSATVVTSVEEALRNMAVGVFPIFLGLEGARILGESLEFLEEVYNYGVRYLTLTHNSNTRWCDSATDKPEHCGIKATGARIIKRCGQLGIYVDVSHVAEKSALRAVELSSKPTIATHSGVAGVFQHERNLSDDLIKEIVQSGGVIGIPFVKKFLGGKSVFEHIDYIAQLHGVDNIGIGSDLDGAILIDEVKDASNWNFFVEDLYRYGYTIQDIGKICGGNWARLLV